MYDVVIIGGGPIGIFSIFSCGMEGLKCAIFDSNSELGGQCKFQYPEKKIYDIPGHKEITASQLIENLIDQSSIFNPDIYLNAFVESIEELLEENQKYFLIKFKDKEIKARAVLVALGAGIYQPVKLSVPFDEKLEGEKIIYKIEKLNRFKDKEVAILGGGDSALDLAIELSKISKKIYLLHRRNVFKAAYYSMNKIMESNNIEKIAPYSLSHIIEQDNKLTIIGEEKNIFVDYIIPCYGAVSNINFLKNWNLDLFKSKIKVNPATMESSRPGIYAIGDCINYDGKRDLILTGFSEASIASRSIFKKLYPNKAFQVNYSTNSDIFIYR
ncbi:NAD(P)/FAD-dependent oxidoreductase [Alphaproteobacteria bacterium endosymbiont of Tiliacea citrago]|uniref:NAD(P)/FAD-dependent oxidoreductase n=1 Tax=Alphaproteobacteria bacterium endosymbiont of Tiliacea citrago TaxID=3077944 RepID=UPI00313CC6CD